MKNILTNIRKQFDGLWKCKERGESLEIITPFVTTNRKFVSVFISARDGNYIVSDGGFIHDGMYDTSMPPNGLRGLDSFWHYGSAFEIMMAMSSQGIEFHYKKVSDPIHIASAVLDLAMFIAAVVSEIDRITD